MKPSTLLTPVSCLLAGLFFSACEKHENAKSEAAHPPETAGQMKAVEPAWENWFTQDDSAQFKRLGGTATYAIEGGTVTGRTEEGSPNSFLCRGPFGDFELQFEVLCDLELNSGVQIRSQIYAEDTVLPGKDGKRPKVRHAGELYGYQCEIVRQETGTAGNFWDEARHRQWWDDFSAKPEAQQAFKNGEWNHYRIRAAGDHIQSWVNGVPCADFHNDLDAEGLIGFQVHSVKKGTGPFEVKWRNVKFKEL